MNPRVRTFVAVASLIVAIALPSTADDWPFRHKAAPEGPNTPEQIARSIDAIEEKILDDGVVVIKQPDVWGQSRMTLYRNDFETVMKGSLTSSEFATVLSARIARSDQAGLQSQTSLAAALTTLTPNAPLMARRGTNNTQITVSPSQILGNYDATGNLTSPGDRDTLQKALTGTAGNPSGSLVAPPDAGSNPIQPTKPFNLLGTTQQPFGADAAAFKNLLLGVEPTVLLDEKKRFLDHLNEIRRINIGDDISDSAGYGLYLFRLPVSIQPGERTRKGFGAVLTTTIRHDFSATFLRDTFRNLVIADLIDVLAPLTYELIREGIVDVDVTNRPAPEAAKPDDPTNPVDLRLEKYRQTITRAIHIPSGRPNTRVFPIPPSELSEIFLIKNLLSIALDTKHALLTQTAEANDVRTYLRHQIEAAYDLLPAYEALIPAIHQQVEAHEYKVLRTRTYPALAAALIGDLRGRPDKALSALCWAIAVDSGLLDRRLRDDIKVTMGQNGFTCPDPDGLAFFGSAPSFEAQDTFTRYVTARWPMIVFALDPVTDQQNLADAFSRRRDLQLALALGFAAGRISLNQLTRFNRRIELDADTIALNRTVSAFSHNSDTFGWRFYPRYQNPPLERNNIQVVTNLLWRGGPGRNYTVKNEKLEAGQRELTAVIIMPAFLERVRLDVTGNWFPLHDPDHMKVHTARMVEQGRQVMELRQSLAAAEACGHYRPGDVERLAVRVEQVEAMLPLQSREVKVPYESTVAGFQLFTPGANAIVPELIGFEGISRIPKNTAVSLLVFGKRLSIHESRVVVGGATPLDTDFEIVSRDILRVNLPASVLPTVSNDDEQHQQQFVELHLATPNGVSNRLLIPYGDPPAPAQPRAPAGYTIEGGHLVINIKNPPAARVSPSALKIRVTEASGVLPATFTLRFAFTLIKNQQGAGPASVDYGDVTMTPDGVIALIDPTALDKLAVDIKSKLDDWVQNNPAPLGLPEQVELQPILEPADATLGTILTINTLVVDLNK